MTITIEVDNREDFEWLQPFLEKLSQKNGIRLNYSLYAVLSVTLRTIKSKASRFTLYSNIKRDA